MELRFLSPDYWGKSFAIDFFIEFDVGRFMCLSFCLMPLEYSLGFRRSVFVRLTRNSCKTISLLTFN